MAELTVPQIDFSSLGQLPAIYKQGQADAVRQQTLASLGQGGQADAAALLRSGDLSLAQLGLTIQQREAEAKRQAMQDTRQATNDKFSHGIQTAQLELSKRAASRADEDKFVLKEVTDPNTGATSIIRIKTTGSEGVVPVGLPPSTPNNPYAVGPKLTQDQGKSATMVDRMVQANDVLDKNKDINEGFAGTLGGMAAAIPKVRDSAIYNAVATPERQQVVQAQRNFVNAILRVESGAAVSQSEFDNAQRQYFPQPGDSKDVKEQKRQNRVTAMQGMARQAGPQYKPPASLVNANSPPVSQGKSGDAIYAAAREALAKGAPRDKVMERLQQNGVDPSGL